MISTEHNVEMTRYNLRPFDAFDSLGKAQVQRCQRFIKVGRWRFAAPSQMAVGCRIWASPSSGNLGIGIRN